MKIIKVGSEAVTVIGEIKGIITAACIRETGVSYEFSYFHNGDHKKEWVTEIEIKVKEGSRETVGYKRSV